MKVTVFGLGYVGCVSAACLADQGHTVVGVDISPAKVEMINQGRSPVIENGLAGLIRQNVAAGRLSATTQAAEAIDKTEVSLICVGTPSTDNGSLDLTSVKRVAGQIGAALARKQQPRHTVVLRSTVLPGTTERVVLPVLEKTSGKTIGHEIGLAFNPEFLREGTALEDFYHPSFTLIGTIDRESAEIAASLYETIEAPVRLMALKTAEVIKYTNNAFHAVKVVFANEIGNLCQVLGIDSRDVMEIFCMDRKLNLSPYYLKPGFAFGGSCLPRNLRAILHLSRHRDLKLLP